MDKIKIRKIVEETIKLYQDYLDCKKLRPDTESLKINDFSDSCVAEKEKVRNYLESLTLEEVNQILALMYAGRDYVICVPEDHVFIPFEDQYQKTKNNEKSVSITQILEKSDLIDYLIAGMEYYSI